MLMDHIVTVGCMSEGNINIISSYVTRLAAGISSLRSPILPEIKENGRKEHAPYILSIQPVKSC